MGLPLGIPRLPVITAIAIFLNYCVFPRLPEGEEEEDESEEHFQQRVERALSVVRQWEWRPEEMKYLPIVENAIRDGRCLENLEG
jgi:hypothetical protein